MAITLKQLEAMRSQAVTELEKFQMAMNKKDLNFIAMKLTPDDFESLQELVEKLEDSPNKRKREGKKPTPKKKKKEETEPRFKKFLVKLSAIHNLLTEVYENPRNISVEITPELKHQVCKFGVSLQSDLSSLGVGTIVRRIWLGFIFCLLKQKTGCSDRNLPQEAKKALKFTVSKTYIKDHQHLYALYCHFPMFVLGMDEKYIGEGYTSSFFSKSWSDIINALGGYSEVNTKHLPDWLARTLPSYNEELYKACFDLNVPLPEIRWPVQEDLTLYVLTPPQDGEYTQPLPLESESDSPTGNLVDEMKNASLGMTSSEMEGVLNDEE